MTRDNENKIMSAKKADWLRLANYFCSIDTSTAVSATDVPIEVSNQSGNPVDWIFNVQYHGPYSN